nr:CAP domain-containing protein [Bacillus tuaregi]
MRKRKFSVFVTPMLILSLVACNNDTNDAMDTRNGNQINTANRAGTNVYQVNNRNREVDDRSAYGFDHRGPLTEDYLDNDDNRAANNNRPTYWTVRNNNNNNMRDNGRNTQNGNQLNTATRGGTNAYQVNNRNREVDDRSAYGFDHRGPLTEDYLENDNNRTTNNNRSPYRTVRNNNDNNRNIHYRNVTNRNDNKWSSQRNKVNNDHNNVTARNKNYDNTNESPNLSSLKTSQSSNKYPHTKAVLIQEARYQFIPVNPNQDNRLQARLRQNKESAQAPEVQKQQQANQAPAQQAPQQQTPAQQAPAPAPAQKAPAQQAPANVSQAVQQVIDLTNEQRRKNGLPALQADTQLSSVAQKKSTDMQQKGYFSHTSPTYGSPFDMMRDHGVSYKTAGENIAQGQRTPQEVVNAWMNSEGHRKNILSREFTHIGVGYEASGHHWTQMFIGK